jgi:hypothetical protein
MKALGATFHPLPMVDKIEVVPSVENTDQALYWLRKSGRQPRRSTHNPALWVVGACIYTDRELVGAAQRVVETELGEAPR